MTYRDEVLADSPIAFWEFNETTGSVVTDTISGWQASLVGGVTLGHQGPKGSKAAYFDGTGYLQVNNFTDFMSSGDFTIEVWAKYGTQTTDYPTFLRRDGNSKTILLRTRGASSGSRTHDIESYNSGRSNYMYSGSAPYADSTWHHVYYTSLSLTQRLWVDNVENNPSYENGTRTTGGTGTAAPLYIGRGSGATEYFTGYLSQVAIYPANKPARVSAHYIAADNAQPYRGWGMPL